MGAGTTSGMSSTTTESTGYPQLDALVAEGSALNPDGSPKVRPPSREVRAQIAKKAKRKAARTSADQERTRQSLDRLSRDMGKKLFPESSVLDDLVTEGYGSFDLDRSREVLRENSFKTLSGGGRVERYRHRSGVQVDLNVQGSWVIHNEVRSAQGRGSKALREVLCGR
jgi:hypothetical protein